MKDYLKLNRSNFNSQSNYVSLNRNNSNEDDDYTLNKIVQIEKKIAEGEMRSLRAKEKISQDASKSLLKVSSTREKLFKMKEEEDVHRWEKFLKRKQDYNE